MCYQIPNYISIQLMPIVYAFFLLFTIACSKLNNKYAIKGNGSYQPNKQYFDGSSAEFGQLSAKVDQHPNTTLHTAILNKNLAELQRLLSTDQASNINTLNADGYSPLMLALLQCININATIEGGRTALHFASDKGHREIVQTLLKTPGIDVNKADNDGYTSLHWASCQSHIEVVEMLLKASGIDVNKVNNDGYTSLHLVSSKWVIESVHKEIVEMFLKTPGIDVNKADNDGYTSLHWASCKGHKEIVEILLKAPGIDVNKVDKKRKTALNLAAESSHTAIVEMLGPLQTNKNCTIL